MKAAVVGSGAAAVAVLEALAEWCPDAEVTVFDIGESPVGPFESSTPPESWSREYTRALYGHLRADHGFKLPAPKSHFGNTPPRANVGGRPRIWLSRQKGGLTNVWGGSMLPFTNRELKGWPFTANDLAPYYARIAKLVGISGRADALSGYFAEDYVNRPPIRSPRAFRALEAVVNGCERTDPYRVVAGVARLALETRSDRLGHCTYSGECMVGCYAGAVYRAGNDIDRHCRDGDGVGYVRGRVLKVNRSNRSLLVRAGQGDETTPPFDRIYLCAGCVGTTEIVMRSLGILEGVPITDNALLSFPVLYLGKTGGESDADRFFALTNVILGCVPKDEAGNFVMAQVYPSSDHLWRGCVPAFLWPTFEILAPALRTRLLWARLYLHGDDSPQYGLRFESGEHLSFTLERPRAPRSRWAPALHSIRRAIRGNGFLVPDLPPIRHATSSHYAASIPVGAGIVSESVVGQIMPGVFVCDSSGFRNAPAISPTFTTMAVASLTAHRSLDA